VGAWALNEGAGALAFNAVNTKRSTLSSGCIWEPEGVNTRYGIGGILLDTQPNVSAGTIVVTATANNDTSVSEFAFGSASSNRRYIIRGQGSYIIQFRCGSGAYFGTIPTISGGIFTSVALWSNNGANSSLYTNGVFSGSATQTANTTPCADATIGIVNLSASQWKEVIHLTLMYGLQLSPEQAISISTNPYQIYEPEIIWVVVGSTGSYSISGTEGGVVGGTATITNQAIVFLDERGRFISAAGVTEQGRSVGTKLTDSGRWTSIFALQTQSIVGTGGYIVGGIGTIAKHLTYSISGNAGGLIGGTATIAKTQTYSISGTEGGLIGGSGTISKTATYDILGNAGGVVGGAAVITSAIYTGSYECVGTGGFLTGGHATYLQGGSLQPTAGGIAGGNAIIYSNQVPTSIVGTGGFIFGGTGLTAYQIYFGLLNVCATLSAYETNVELSTNSVETDLTYNEIQCKVLV
jgi:hypothetical protein